MDRRREIRDFLISRRAAVVPAQVGLIAGPRRRVPGLRRSEVADLAGISVEYYARLERGELDGATDAVLDAIARALLLDEEERAHLFDLARARRASRREPSSAEVMRPGIRQTLDSLGAPALIVNSRTDVLAANPLGRALYADMFDVGPEAADGPNYARFVFLHPAAPTLYRDWDQAADEVVATLRSSIGRTPADGALDELVDALSASSEPFRRRWAQYPVRQRSFGLKRLHHRAVGALELAYETINFPTEPGLAMMIYSAAPGSGSADALRLLSVWAGEQAMSSRDG